MVRIFGTEIPPAGRFVSGAWVPATPEDYRVKVMNSDGEGNKWPDPRTKRFGINGVFHTGNLPGGREVIVALGTTDRLEDLDDLVKHAKTLYRFAGEYFHHLELCDFYQGLMWTLPCRGA